MPHIIILITIVNNSIYVIIFIYNIFISTTVMIYTMNVIIAMSHIFVSIKVVFHSNYNIRAELDTIFLKHLLHAMNNNIAVNIHIFL